MPDSRADAARTRAVASSSPHAASSDTGPTWRVQLLPGVLFDVGAVDVEACVAARVPTRLRRDDSPSSFFVSDARGRDGQPLVVDDDGIALPADGCVRYVVQLEAAAIAWHSWDSALPVGRSVLASPDTWLLRPAPWPVDDDGTLIPGTLVVTSPDPQLRAAVPFAPTDAPDDGDARVVSSSAFGLRAWTALGAWAPDSFDADGAHFEIARLGPTALDDDRGRAWMIDAAHDVATPLGRFPVPRALLVLLPAPFVASVQVGLLGRGGGMSALFVVGQSPPPVGEPLVDGGGGSGRWVLTHELAHALLPPIDTRDAWLHEGLTTFHQEVLPARARAARGEPVDVDTTWRSLVDGLRVGAQRAREDGLTVEESCVQMHARHTYQHCYWAGAAIALQADAALRNDGGSLDDLVRACTARRFDASPRRALDLLALIIAGDDARASRAAKALRDAYLAARNRAFPIVDTDAVAPSLRAAIVRGDNQGR